MIGQSPQGIPQDTGGKKEESSSVPNNPHFKGSRSLWRLLRGDSAFQFGLNIFTLLLIFVVAGLGLFHFLPARSGQVGFSRPASTPTSQGDPVTVQLPPELSTVLDGITRLANAHTTIPDRPRIDVTQYTVQTGDSIFLIAKNFNLKPATILLGNYTTLKDDVDLLRPGQVLNILPVDGAYYQWQGTENLNTVAKYYNVTSDDIIQSPANKIDPTTIGDPVHPNIAAGTWLVVPGGTVQFSWHAPIGVPRSGAGSSTTTVTGAGACGKVTGGNVGYGTFIFPTVEHWLSGTDYRPDVGHYGVDFAGSLGNAVYAADAGVVVYAGWNDWGYGNLIILDHGNGWQSLYGHLSQINVSCAESVGQGDVIGLVGSTGHSTGPHLHFELSYNRAPVNPHTILDIAPR